MAPEAIFAAEEEGMVLAQAAECVRGRQAPRMALVASTQLRPNSPPRSAPCNVSSALRLD